MNAAKHTPGPWQFEIGQFNRPDDDYGGCPGSIKGGSESDGWFVATIEDAPEALANARLIEAAPELLEALQALVTFAKPFGAFRDDLGEGVENYCNEVIAKATGQGSPVATPPSNAEEIVP